jgi:ribonuclease HI
MHVTCFTDASFFHGRGAGWGVSLRPSSGHRIERRGSCPSTVSSSNEAELWAILIGVTLAESAWPTTTHVSVCSDSRSALAACDPSVPLPKSPGMRALAVRMRRVRERIAIDLRWVKGHRGINIRCDALARRAALDVVQRTARVLASATTSTLRR